MGREETEANPTIVVMVTSGAEADWSRMEGRIQALVNQVSRPSDPTIEIEFLPGKCKVLPSETDGVSYLLRLEDDGLPRMGTSVGVTNSEHGGSLGGFVALKCGDIIRKGFITNYHAVRPQGGMAGRLHEQADRHGSSIFVEDETRTTLLYLLPQDTAESISQAAEHIHEAEQQLREFNRINDERVCAGMSTAGVQRNINNVLELLRTYQTRKEKFEQMPHVIGRVAMSSGKTVTEKVGNDPPRVLDWAFVEMTDSRYWGPNVLPPIPSHSRLVPEMATGNILSGNIPLGFGKVVPGEMYFKCGRSTDVTAGICNGVEAYVNWKDSDCIRYDASGQEVNITGGYTEEFAVLSRTSTHAGTFQSGFCAPGDSGSFLLDKAGHVCGLLYGRLNGECGPPDNPTMLYNCAGLVTCMSVVRESIESKATPRGPSGDPIGPRPILSLAE